MKNLILILLLLLYISCGDTVTKEFDESKYCLEIFEVNFYKYCEDNSDCWENYLHHFAMSMATDYAYDEVIEETHYKVFTVVWSQLKSLQNEDLSYEMSYYILSELARLNVPEKRISEIVGEKEWGSRKKILRRLDT